MFRYLDDFGTYSKESCSKEEAEKRNKEIDEQGLDEYGHWVEITE